MSEKKELTPELTALLKAIELGYRLASGGRTLDPELTTQPKHPCKHSGFGVCEHCGMEVK